MPVNRKRRTRKAAGKRTIPLTVLEKRLERLGRLVAARRRRGR